jgi:hypothetical protein
MSTMRLLAIAGFTLAFAIFAFVEVMARRPKSRIPTLGDLSGFVMRYQVGGLPVGRIGLFGFWWWIGWHFFAR